MQVPSFEDRPDNFVVLILVKPGDKALLDDGKSLLAITARLNEATGSRPDQRSPENPAQRRVDLATVADAFGLPPDQIDAAIRAWGKRTQDPFEVGMVALYERRYGDAVANLRQSLTIQTAEADLARRRVIDSARFLGYALLEQGQYREAAQMLLEVNAKFHDSSLSFPLATFLQRAGDYAAAESLYRSIVRDYEGGTDKNMPTEVRWSIGNLGFVLAQQYRLKEALTFAQRVFDMDVKIFGDKHLEVAEDLNIRGLILQDLGDFAGAQRDFTQAIAIVRNGNDPDSRRNHGWFLNNLGTLFWRKGDYRQAEHYCRLALDVHSKLFPPGHGELGRDQNNIALNLLEQGQYQEAERLLQQAYDIDVRAYGRTELETTHVIGNLGFVYSRTNRPKEAEEHLRRALQIRRQKLGDHPWTAYSEVTLGRFLSETGRLDESEELLRSAVETYERKVDRGFVFAALAFYERGRNLQRLGRYDDAMRSLSEAHNRLAPLRGKQHPSVEAIRAALDDMKQATGPSAPK